MTTQTQGLARKVAWVWPGVRAGAGLRPWLRRYAWLALLGVGIGAAVVTNLRPTLGGTAARPVRLAEVKRGPLSVEVLATGAVQPKERVEVRYPDDSAEVAAVLVEAGQNVADGQPLVRLATEALLERVRRTRSEYLESSYRLADLRSGRRETKLRTLEVAVERATGELNFQESRLVQVRELTQQGLIARWDLEKSEHDVAVARLALEEAQLQLSADRRSRKREEEASLQAELTYRRLALERAEMALARSTLRSPAAGTVLELPIGRGTSLRQGDLVAVVADVGQFRVSALVDEMQVGRLRVGQPVWVRNEFFGDARLEGKLERIVPLVRKERGVPSVQILVAVADGRRQPPAGLTVDVGVRIEQTGDVTQVPLEAVVERQGRAVVFTCESGHARRHPISVGLRSDSFVEVLSGVAAGDRVITAGHTSLQGGEAVHPVEEGSSGSLQVEFFR